MTMTTAAAATATVMVEAKITDFLIQRVLKRASNEYWHARYGALHPIAPKSSNSESSSHTGSLTSGEANIDVRARMFSPHIASSMDSAGIASSSSSSQSSPSSSPSSLPSSSSSLFSSLTSHFSSTNVRSERELISALLQERPEMRRNFACHTQSGRNLSFYMYDERRGIWNPINNNRMEYILERGIGEHVRDLTRRERLVVESDTKIAALRRTFGKSIDDPELLEKFRLSENLFALHNGLVVDATCPNLVRKTRREDYVSTTCGWSYDTEAAHRHRSELIAFLRKILPNRGERRVVLRYLASLLHGHRRDKRFLVLTDYRQGNNGKSTLFALLHKFFGTAYARESTKFLCRANYERDRDSHDASLDSMRNKRLLLVDELKNYMKFNEAFIKKITSNECTITGRTLGSANYFTYKWQAGIVIAFNENDCAKFDLQDEAFLARMLVCPMRSKFVPTSEGRECEMRAHDHDEDHDDDDDDEVNVENKSWQTAVKDEDEEEEDNDLEFIMDPNITSRFDDWRSSMLDLLLKHYSIEGTTSMEIPLSMRIMRQRLLRDLYVRENEDNSELMDWMEENLLPDTVGGDSYLTMDGIRKAYESYEQRHANETEDSTDEEHQQQQVSASQCSREQLGRPRPRPRRRGNRWVKNFNDRLEMILKVRNIPLVRRHRFVQEQRRLEKRNVILGYRLRA